MQLLQSLIVGAGCAVLLGCATPASSPAPVASATPAPAVAAPATAAAASPYGPVRTVKSRDGSFDGELIGTSASGSKFSKLTIGMALDEVTGLIGAPDNMVRHETGKRWIPFYFGSDAQRLQVLYRGEGCLTFTAGNVFGGGGNVLIRVTATTRVDCME